MNFHSGIYSSKRLMEVIKCQIKKEFDNQENFANKLGYSRKQINRIINHPEEFETICKICKMLDIKGALFD